MEKIKTQDSSITFHNEKVGETYHSVSGAFDEAFFKFVEPLKIKQDMIVFDICFGFGYNSAMLIHWYFEHFDKGLEIIGFEQAKDLQRLTRGLEVPEFIASAYDIIKQGEVDTNSLKLKILYGDARATILQVKQKAHAVMLDPFSPKRAPELWQKDFLQAIYDRMHKGGILTTYSCARLVRDNLKACGFRVVDGPKVGRRGPSTIALKGKHF